MIRGNSRHEDMWIFRSSHRRPGVRFDPRPPSARRRAASIRQFAMAVQPSPKSFLRRLTPDLAAGVMAGAGAEFGAGAAEDAIRRFDALRADASRTA